jgi:hypothetical protein
MKNISHSYITVEFLSFHPSTLALFLDREKGLRKLAELEFTSSTMATGRSHGS